MKSLNEIAKEHVLLAAHRGVAGGNIPCNTLAAYEIALRQGADIVEIDVARTLDDKLFVFHPGMESPHLYSPVKIKNMTADEVKGLRYVNQDDVRTTDIVSSLDDVLDFLKGRCYVNIDKFWTAMPEITEAVRRHHMEKDVIVKTDAHTKWFDMVEQYAPDLPYMAIISEEDTVTDDLLKRNINYIGAEVIFKNDTDSVASPEYIQKMHDKGLLLWANAIVYNYRSVLTGGHSDDVSLTANPDDGWGWLAKRGFDIIQTDWTLPARLYLEQLK